jgi:hypothetical protein
MRRQADDSFALRRVQLAGEERYAEQEKLHKGGNENSSVY